MRRAFLSLLLLVVLAEADENLGGSRPALGAAPTAPTYLAVERTIRKVRDDWGKTAPDKLESAGWNTLFDAILNTLKNYASATTEDDRLRALDSLHGISVSLATVPWQPALDVRESLREWLRPRVRLAWAERRLVERVNGLPPAPTADSQANRQHWINFVNNELGQALGKYNAATTVGQRREALTEVNVRLKALEDRNRAYAWSPSLALQGALTDLFDKPNLDVSVDVYTLSPSINTNLVTNGPIYRKGYWSQVTAGPKTGFGLLPSDDGIAFYNKQLLTSVTPITDFQQQIARDPKGQRAAKLYRFDATTVDQAELTITVSLRSTGLQITPSYTHNTDLNLCLSPQPGGHLGRSIAALVGFDQERIRQEVYKGAIGRIRENVVTEALEEGTERTSREAANRNAQLSQNLIGNDRLLYRNLLIEHLTLRSRPENALIGGTYRHLNGDAIFGSDIPKPVSLLVPDSGVSADIHLNSLLNNYVSGAYKTETVQNVQNFLIVTKNVPPGTPPRDGVTVTRNVDFPTYLKAVAEAKQANDPKVQALRIKRPEFAPEFSIDAHGNLVVEAHDFQMDIPTPAQAPPAALAGPPAKAYRIVAPNAEFTISLKTVGKPGERLRFVGKVEAFDHGPNAKVLAIGDDESQARPLTNFTSTFILGILRTRIQGQPIDLPLPNVPLQGFAIRSVSPLDPSGWIRVTLDKTGPALTSTTP